MSSQGLTVDDADLELLAETLRKIMTSADGGPVDDGLRGTGWPELLVELPHIAIPLVFRLLGETGAHASVLNDVVLADLGRPLGGTVALPYAGGSAVLWDRDPAAPGTLDEALPLRRVDHAEEIVSADGRRALAWWLIGTSRAMLALARTHALDRTQFGKPVASFQAVRHRLAETLVAIEGAEAAAHSAADDLGALLAKAAAGRAALTAAKHCQQVLGGIGFTAEHDLHRHIKRALVLDGILGSTRELLREAGAHIRTAGTAPRLVHLT